MGTQERGQLTQLEEMREIHKAGDTWIPFGRAQVLEGFAGGLLEHFVSCSE